MKNNLVTHSFYETQKLGKDFIERTSNRIIALGGELGSGKTTFVQGIALGLGIKSRITSPTFLIIKSYKINNKKIKEKRLYHVDLYRVDSAKDIIGMELEEIINDPLNIVVIEWPKIIKKILPKKKALINFNYINENDRKILINE